jgi:hypothetical protein
MQHVLRGRNVHGMTVELVRPFAVIKSVVSSDVNTVRVFRSYDGMGL